MEKVNNWTKKHPQLWEFIKFNVLSNIATITNFIVLFITTAFIFRALVNTPCLILRLGFISEDAYLFRYPAAPTGTGLCGFLGFLCAYLCAQIVNYIVQRKLVFGATVDIKKTIGWYIATVAFAGLVCQVWSGYGTEILMSNFGMGESMASLITNMVNILIQVVINYPMMKFVVMKKETR